jgi:hypothetical protein
MWGLSDEVTVVVLGNWRVGVTLDHLREAVKHVTYFRLLVQCLWLVKKVLQVGTVLILVEVYRENLDMDIVAFSDL